ncbi:MAG: type II toxin-antitoxin system RelE/ParE family toxin [Prolixibacteraceae bacterium]|nr:type II toxin-antitoxin system RelE/ParE family toxin [Prolixibacteraceae bacterium]
MSRQIVFYGKYFIDFYKVLDSNVKAKIQYVLELIKQVNHIPKKFLAPIANYEGLFEIRIKYQSNIYRIFCCFDKGKLVVLFNAFQKKTQKTPKKEIDKAKQLMNEYFNKK